MDTPETLKAKYETMRLSQACQRIIEKHGVKLLEGLERPMTMILMPMEKGWHTGIVSLLHVSENSPLEAVRMLLQTLLGREQELGLEKTDLGEDVLPAAALTIERKEP